MFYRLFFEERLPAMLAAVAFRRRFSEECLESVSWMDLEPAGTALDLVVAEGAEKLFPGELYRVIRAGTKMVMGMKRR